MLTGEYHGGGYIIQTGTSETHHRRFEAYSFRFINDGEFNVHVGLAVV